jgi:hypothetical protein
VSFGLWSNPSRLKRRSRTASRDARYRVSPTACSDRAFEDIHDILRVDDRIRGPGRLRRAALALTCYPWAGSSSANKRSSPSNAPGTKPEIATVLLLDDDTIRRWHGAFAEGGRNALIRFEAGGSAYALSEAQQEKPRRGFDHVLIRSIFRIAFLGRLRENGPRCSAEQSA